MEEELGSLERKTLEELFEAAYNLGEFNERILILLKEKPEGYDETINRIYKDQYLAKIKPILEKYKSQSDLIKANILLFEKRYEKWKKDPFTPFEDFL